MFQSVAKHTKIAHYLTDLFKIKVLKVVFGKKMPLMLIYFQIGCVGIDGSVLDTGIIRPNFNNYKSPLGPKDRHWIIDTVIEIC